MRNLNVASPPPRRKLIYFSIFISFMFVLLFSLQSCQEATAPTFNSNLTTNNLAKQQLNELDDLSIISNYFSQILVDNEIKDFLKGAINNANTKENILDAKEFFTRKILSGKFRNTSLMNLMLLKTKNQNKKILSNIFARLEKGKVDIYFPIKGQFEEWLKNKNNLLIGYSIPEREWEPVIVYDLKGNSFQLSGKGKPTTPVLMVIGCEHNGNHSLPLKTSVDYQQGTGDDDDGGGYVGGGGGSTSHGPRVNGKKEILYSVRFNTLSEGYFMGDPEYYYVAACSKSTSEIEKVYLTNVTTMNHTYTLNQDMFYYWWNDYGNWYKMKFAESDGGSFSITIKYGVSVTINIKNGDDDLGFKSVNKQDPYNASYDTGHAKFYIRYHE